MPKQKYSKEIDHKVKKHGESIKRSNIHRILWRYIKVNELVACEVNRKTREREGKVNIIIK